MKTFLGIPIHKSLSDGEFIEKQRKTLRMSKRVAWFNLAVVLAFSILIPEFFKQFSSAIDRMPDNARKLAYNGLQLGLLFGLVISGCIASAAGAVIRGFNLFHVNRGTELLVKYHDILKQVATQQSCEQQLGQVSSDGAPSDEPSS